MSEDKRKYHSPRKIPPSGKQPLSPSGAHEKVFSGGFLISVSLSATDLVSLIKISIFDSLRFK